MNLKDLLIQYTHEDKDLAIKIFSQASSLYASGSLREVSRQVWFDFLDLTSKPFFLRQLDEKERYRWAEIVFKVLQLTNYGLRDMFERRVREHPHKVLF